MQSPSEGINSAKLRVGLVGLGLMGRGLGLSLLRASHPLRVIANRKRDVLEELCAHGAVESATPAEMAAQVDVVVLCLPSAESSRKVLVGAKGIAQGAAPGLTVMECSTLMPSDAVVLQEELRKVGVGFVDCPVTRGPREAVAGTLNALMGADDEEHAARAELVASAFCERIFRLGKTGSGYTAKLINNFLSFSNMAAIAEAMTTARESGLDLQTVIEAVSVSGGASKSLSGYAPWLVRGEAPSSILSVATAVKDISYYCRHADSTGTLGPVAQQSKRSWDAAAAAGLADELSTAYFEKVAKDASIRRGNP